MFLVVVREASDPGVDGVCGEEGLGVEVDGWDVDGASELLSLDDGADEFVGSSEGVGRVADTALLEEPADEGGGCGDNGLVGECDFDWAEDVGGDASEVAVFGEEFGGSGAALSEMEVVSFDDDAGLVLVDELVEEGFGVLGEKVWGRGEFDDFIGSGGEEAGFADLEWIDLGGGAVWGEDGEGVRVEAEDDYTPVGTVVGIGVVAGTLDEHLVSLVDSVVVPDGEGDGLGVLLSGRIGHTEVYQGRCG